MSILQAGIHAHEIMIKKGMAISETGYTPSKKGRKTLLDALAEARKGLTRDERIDLLWRTINREAGR